MAMPHDASKPRKGFVLKCDKPRYDGGVELNLEKYFGRLLQPNQAALRSAATFANEANITPQQVEALKRKAQELLASLPDGSRMTLSKPAATHHANEATALMATMPAAKAITQQTCLNEAEPSHTANADATPAIQSSATHAMPALEASYLPTHFMVCGLSLLGGMVGMSVAHCLHDPMAYHQSQHLLSQSWQAVCVVLKQSLPTPFKHSL